MTQSLYQAVKGEHAHQYRIPPEKTNILRLQFKISDLTIPAFLRAKWFVKSNVYTSEEFLKQPFQNIWKILSSPEFLLALTNTSSPKRRGLLIAGRVSLVLTLTVIGIGIGVG